MHWLPVCSSGVCSIFFLPQIDTNTICIRMKAIIFTLVRSFEFELAVPNEDIGSKSSAVQRPILRSDLAAGNTMPLFVKLYTQ